MSIFTRRFGLQALERAIKTLCQSAAALLVANATGLLDVDWAAIASVAGLAALVSILTSYGSGAVGDDSPSLVEVAPGTGKRIRVEG